MKFKDQECKIKILKTDTVEGLTNMIEEFTDIVDIQFSTHSAMGDNVYCALVIYKEVK